VEERAMTTLRHLQLWRHVAIGNELCGCETADLWCTDYLGIYTQPLFYALVAFLRKWA